MIKSQNNTFLSFLSFAFFLYLRINRTVGVPNNPKPKESLVEIFKSHDGNIADKWDSYIYLYSKLFQTYKTKSANIRILEIGVLNGGSLQIWHDYFGPNSEIHGIDYNVKTCDMNLGSGIELHCFDATDEDKITSFIQDQDPFDIIIDDGSHKNSDIVQSFKYLFSHLAPGGMYVVEDLFESFANFDQEKQLVDSASAVHFFQKLVNYVNIFHITRAQKVAKMSLEEIYFSEHIQGVEFHDAQIVISKRLVPRTAPMNVVLTGKEIIVTPKYQIDEARDKGYFDNTQAMGSSGDPEEPPEYVTGSQMTHKYFVYINPELHYDPSGHLLFWFNRPVGDLGEAELLERCFSFCSKYHLFFQTQNCDTLLLELSLKEVVKRDDEEKEYNENSSSESDQLEDPYEGDEEEPETEDDLESDTEDENDDLSDDDEL